MGKSYYCIPTVNLPGTQALLTRRQIVLVNRDFKLDGRISRDGVLDMSRRFGWKNGARRRCQHQVNWFLQVGLRITA
jgi:hypothetical protein